MSILKFLLVYSSTTSVAASHSCCRWATPCSIEVVGGADKGGIIVREETVWFWIFANKHPAEFLSTLHCIAL